MEEVEAIDYVEQYKSNIDCANCEYSGQMMGYCNPADPKLILFVCPECGGAERVVNPLI